MNEYISLEDALTVVKYSKTPVVGMKNLPRLAPNEIVKHSRWIFCVCQECKNIDQFERPYCSNCGAKMDLEE